MTVFLQPISPIEDNVTLTLPSPVKGEETIYTGFPPEFTPYTDMGLE
jgi:hypothetical protein